MAGTIFGLGLMQQFDANGAPLNGCKLYIYTAGTSTPVTIYQDFSLSIEHTFPLEADSAGRIPAFWLADGTYRVRLLDVDGNEIFDEDNLTAIGASSGTGGGSGATTPAEAIFQTGDFLWLPVSGSRTGWVRGSGRTIGSAASGATERANADCEDLFLFLWATYSNTLCPVGGGRGVSAAADWGANKTIATLDMRDTAPFGLSDMGNTSTGILGTSAASSGGAATVTVAQANLPNVILSGTASGITDTAAAHTHFLYSSTGSNFALSSTAPYARTTGNSYAMTGTTIETPDVGLSSTAGAHSHVVTVSTVKVSLGGSGTALNKMPPYRLGTWYIRL